MAVDTKKQIIKQIRERKYLNRDFGSFKRDLLDYARTFYPNQIQDFSDSSLGGMFLELASYVGDTQSFYLDHQFHELDPDTAVENVNIERHLKNAGVPIVGAAPSVVSSNILIKVPADGTPAVPRADAFPVIRASSVARARNGTYFELVEDVDFAQVDDNGNLVASVVIATRNAQNVPTSFILTLPGTFISGFRSVETLVVGAFQPFMKFTLGKDNITEIISVADAEGNDYYEVEYLTQDTVFKAVASKNEDNDIVKDNLVPIPAPYRFIKDVSLNTRLTTLTFGGGSAASIDNDIIPDPSEFAVPLYGKRTFSRFTLDPGKMLQTSTLGALAPNTTLQVEYRYGGGLSHNVIEGSIKDITSLVIAFPSNPPTNIAQSVRASIDITNPFAAAGGDDPPSVDDLKTRIPAVRASQGRIVGKEDLLARIYTMPSNFGRVFRAAIHPNPNNPLASRLFILSRTFDSKLTVSPDTLKDNLSKYLNQFRLISDAIDILDGQVINMKVDFSVVIDPTFSSNKNIILQSIIAKLRKYFATTNFDMDQPLVMNEIENLIYNTQGVLSVNEVNIRNVFGEVGLENPRRYSTIQYDFDVNTDRGIIFGPAGSMFELRFPEFDIVGTAV